MTIPAAARSRGFVLIIVLWTVGILALLVTSLVGDAGMDARLSAMHREQTVARAAADAVLASVIIETLRNGQRAPGARRFGDADVTVSLQDYSGRVNPNLASARVLQDLLQEVGVPPRRSENLADAIVDWRTPTEVASPHGAKAPAYLAAGLRYGPTGRPFEHLNELGYVLGMDAATLAALTPRMSLWSDRDPGVSRANRLVFAAPHSATIRPIAPPEAEGRIIAITADARLASGQRAIRRAVVRFGPSPNGPAWRILAWDDGEAWWRMSQKIPQINGMAAR